jgi:hypothetical protein
LHHLWPTVKVYWSSRTYQPRREAPVIS